MNDEAPLLTHVMQTQPLNCVSACLSMLTGRPIEDITAEFHDRYHAAEIDVRDYLREKGVPHTRLLAEQRGPAADLIYIAAVPSLNLEGHLHQLLIEMTKDGKRWWVFDPNLGRDGVKHYTATTLNAYVLEYAIPRQWLRDQQEARS